MQAQKVVVLGSINIDIFLKIDRQPQVGETMACNNMTVGYGGKGANQAIACAKMGAQCTMLGQVGKDDLTADKYLTWMREQGVNTELIQKTDVPTGQAYIYHYPNGDNSIILVGGANKAYKHIPNSWVQAVVEADVLLCQREIPEWVNIHCGKHAKMLILDCGGSLEPISDELIDLCHIVSPNALERECLIGKFPKDMQIEYLERLVASKSHLSILSKEGQNGATFLCKENGASHGDAFKENTQLDGLTVVNTTGAGDTFTAAFAVKKDLTFAAAAAFLCICKNGAAESIPTESEVADFLNKRSV